MKKLHLNINLKGQQLTIVNESSNVSLNTIYDDSISYIKNITNAFSNEYGVVEYLVDQEDEDKAYIVLCRLCEETT